MEAGELVQAHPHRLTWHMKEQETCLSKEKDRDTCSFLSDLHMNAMAHTHNMNVSANIHTYKYVHVFICTYHTYTQKIKIISLKIHVGGY